MGFEPTTSGSTDQRSYQLSYTHRLSDFLPAAAFQSRYSRTVEFSSCKFYHKLMDSATVYEKIF